MTIYQAWKKMPHSLRKPITIFGEKILPFLYLGGKRVTFKSITFDVEINSLGALRRSKEFTYKEGAFTDAVYHAAQKHQVIYDIGAHVGYYALLIALTNPSSKVIALEPEEGNYAALTRNVNKNRGSNIITKNIAVGKTNTDLFFEGSNTSPRAGGGSHQLAHHGDGQRVKAVRLDDWLNSEEVPLPSMILMDIEGGELAALKGMEQTLIIHSPELFIEIHADLLQERGESENMLDEYLKELGYQKEVLRHPIGERYEHKQKHARYSRLPLNEELYESL